MSHPARILENMGRKRNGPKVKYVQPGYRHRAPAAPPGPEQRAARLSTPQVLEKITRAKMQRDEADAELAALIDHAVTLGISWPDIARRLGVTRQAARQQHRRRHRDQAEEHGQDHAA